MNFPRLNACLAASAAGAVLLTASSLHAQQPSETELRRVAVESANGTDAGEGAGTVKGIVAKKSKSAPKTATPLIETPQAVNVVTRDQMDAQGANSIAEALRTVRQNLRYAAAAIFQLRSERSRGSTIMRPSTSPK